MLEQLNTSKEQLILHEQFSVKEAKPIVREPAKHVTIAAMHCAALAIGRAPTMQTLADALDRLTELHRRTADLLRPTESTGPVQ